MTASGVQVRDPQALAARFVRHLGLRGHHDEADIVSDALLGIVKAVRDYDPASDVPLIPFCWLRMRSSVANGFRHRDRYRRREIVLDSDGYDGEWTRCRTTDTAFKQVEDRLVLQRWADMAHLSDDQADAVAWMAVHGGIYGVRLDSTGGSYSNYRSGLARFRRVATTGRSLRPAHPHQAARTAIDERVALAMRVLDTTIGHGDAGQRVRALVKQAVRRRPEHRWVVCCTPGNYAVTAATPGDVAAASAGRSCVVLVDLGAPTEVDQFRRRERAWDELVTAARAVRAQMAADGVPLTQRRFRACMRDAGYPLGEHRARALLDQLRTIDPAGPAGEVAWGRPTPTPTPAPAAPVAGGDP